jgi:hypothetical protein
MRRQESALAWVHPSVRDTVIEYLTEHDSERQRFLRSATSEGVLLALRTRERGTRSPPLRLLRSPADWAVLGDAVRAIAASGDLADQESLLRGVGEALDGCSNDARAGADAAGLGRTLIDSLCQNWQGASAGLTASLLEAFYDLSVRTRYLVPEPDVSLAWRRASANLRSALRQPATDSALGAVSQWIRLVRVLQLNQPRFIRIQRKDVDEYTGRIVSWLQRSDGLPQADRGSPAGTGHRARPHLVPRPGEDDAAQRRRIDAAVSLLEEMAAVRSRAGLEPDAAAFDIVEFFSDL